MSSIFDTNHYWKLAMSESGASHKSVIVRRGGPKEEGEENKNQMLGSVIRLFKL